MKRILIDYNEDELPTKRIFLQKVDFLLTNRFGNPSPARKDPVHELILTILSQNTSDHNRDLAFNKLMNRWPSWDEIAHAAPEEIEDAIRSGGLAYQKSHRIKEILYWIKSQSGEYKLDWLDSLPLKEALERLTALKGVGIKTASVLMCFSFDAPVFPVDVHVHRICRRLNLSPEKGTAETTHFYLQPLIPENRWKELHLNMLQLGRSDCRPSKPDCPACPLTKICPSGGKI